MEIRTKKDVPIIIFSIIIISFSINVANADTAIVPEWVKTNALWYGQGLITETEFLNLVWFLIENEVITFEDDIISTENLKSEIIIPNGNFDISGSSFYLPLNLETSRGATVTWVNEDSVPHTIQSQDEYGKVSGIFNSSPLNTGDRFEFMFEESGSYNYFCSFHPWRVGIVTIK